MEPLDVSTLRPDALLLVDTAPLIYVLEGNERFAPRFEPVFRLQESGKVRFAVTTVTIAEVLVGPIQKGQDGLAAKYRALLESWVVVPLDADIAASAARLRVAHGLKLADAVQAASALLIGADALVTHDRDFSRVSGLSILG